MELYYVFLFFVSSASGFAFQDGFEDPFRDYIPNSISHHISEEGRINILEAPFMAVIYADVSYPEFPYSIGLILSNRWILTTAKFLEMQRGKHLKVLVGMDNIHGIQEKARIHGYSVIQQILHSDYKLTEVYNDIALIKVDKDIEFNDRQQYIPLMSPNELTEYQYHNQNRIKMTVFNYGSKDEASKLYLKRNILFVNTKVVNLNERLFVSAQKSLPTCHGDSGSPAIVDGKLVGLLSVEYTCGLQYPNVFTSILYYREWIMNAMRSN